MQIYQLNNGAFLNKIFNTCAYFFSLLKLDVSLVLPAMKL